MSDAFWGGMWVAIPAMFAAMLAYRKSHSAEVKSAETEKQLIKVVQNGHGPSTINTLSIEELTAAVKLLIEEVKQLREKVLALEELHHLDAELKE